MCFLIHRLPKPALQRLCCQARLGQSHFRAETCSPEAQIGALSGWSLPPRHLPQPCGPGPCCGPTTRLRQKAPVEEDPGDGRSRSLTEGPWGRGGRPQRGRRHRKGSAPSCQFYQRSRAAVPAPRGSCNSHKQKPKGGTPPAALEDCGAPTPFTGLPGPRARGWEGPRVTALLPRWVGEAAPLAALPQAPGRPNLLGEGNSKLGRG